MGSKINWEAGDGVNAAPEGAKPSDIWLNEGMVIMTQIANPIFKNSPANHRKRVRGFSQAREKRKEGYTDLASAGVRLPISIVRAKVCANRAALSGDMAYS